MDQIHQFVCFQRYGWQHDTRIDCRQMYFLGPTLPPVRTKFNYISISTGFNSLGVSRRGEDMAMSSLSYGGIVSGDLGVLLLRGTLSLEPCGLPL